MVHHIAPYHVLISIASNPYRELHVLPTVLSIFMSYVSAIFILGSTAEMYMFGTQVNLTFSAILYKPIDIPSEALSIIIV